MKNYTKILFFLDGACFGELAFIFSTTRTATVTSITDMELISIGREDFFEIFMTKNNGEEPEHIKYLRNCAFMKYWPIEKLIEYPQNCHYHYYKRGQVIVHNSNHCDYVYIIKSGICQVLKKLNDVKPRRILSARIPQIKEEYIESAYHHKVDSGLPFKRGKTAGAFLKNEKTSHLRWSAQTSTSYQAPEAKPIFLLMQVLKEGEIFGLDLLKFDETDNDYPNPEVSLVSQGAEVLMLSMEYFLRYSNDDVKDHVRQMIQVYPRTEEMQRRLQHEADWTNFKNETLHGIYSKSKKQ